MASTFSDSIIYEGSFLFDDAIEGGEPPRKIITNYTALEAALEKNSRDSENPVQQTKKQSTLFSTFCPVQSDRLDDPYVVPEIEQQIFNPLPPPPRPSRRFKKE